MGYVWDMLYWICMGYLWNTYGICNY
jgi:hypothetical protein